MMMGGTSRVASQSYTHCLYSSRSSGLTMSCRLSAQTEKYSESVSHWIQDKITPRKEVIEKLKIKSEQDEFRVTVNEKPYVQRLIIADALF